MGGHVVQNRERDRQQLVVSQLALATMAAVSGP